MDILVTRRLTLRPPLEVDAEAIAVALQNPNITHMLTSVPSPYSVDDALSFINEANADENSVHMSIYHQRLLGIVSVSPKNGNSADLGYWLDQPAWSKGYATEAARAVLSHAFRKFGHSEIHSGAYEDNPASLAVLSKLGFEETGTTQQHFNGTRNCEAPCKRVLLTRERFEHMFGSLETNVAA